MTPTSGNVPERGTLDYGAWNLWRNGLDGMEGQRVLLITDETTVELGNALQRQAYALTGREVMRYRLGEFGQRPFTGPIESLNECLNTCDIAMYAASVGEGELAFRRPLVGAAMKLPIRYVHSPSITDKMMLTGMHTDIDACRKTSKEMHERLSEAQWMHVTNKAGTDLRLEFDSARRWVSDSWKFKPGRMQNAPSGEEFGAPINTTGRYVVDGVLGDWFDRKYGSLAKTPVTFQVRKNRVTEIICPGNSDLEREIRNYVFERGNEEIGEIGIGLLYVPPVEGMLQDEKIAGAHVADGFIPAHEEIGVSPNGCPDHCDGVLMGASVEINTGFLVREGQIFL